ncbi:hypothetical protein L798_01344 [Zootermopsis nevadensis]|uniref:Uncharacterized protein n=1 Tax=Zootermopsis nevadensis TaxID=136037 RepID=A0A067QLS4_ZOONE|nr:hypothetical protein L798_01344 [Zootermopsis nevadensis]
MMFMILCVFKIIIPEMKAMYHVIVADINEFLETVRWRLPKEDAVDMGLVSVELFAIIICQGVWNKYQT